MAKNITIAGASYTGVPAVNLQQTGGGTAKFVDTSGATVTPDSLLEGFTAYGADGELIEGQYIAEAAGDGGAGLPDTIIAGDTPVLLNAGAYNATSTSLKNTGISLTIPKDGTYRFKWTMTGGDPSKTAIISPLYKNGTAVGTQKSTNVSLACSEDLTCVAGDTVSIYFAGYSYFGRYFGGVGNLCACIDWDIDWNGSSGSGSGGNAFPYKVTIVSTGALTSMTPTLCYGDDGDSLVVLTNVSSLGGVQTIRNVTCENCRLVSENNSGTSYGYYTVFNNFTGDATITFDWFYNGQ